VSREYIEYFDCLRNVKLFVFFFKNVYFLETIAVHSICISMSVNIGGFRWGRT